MKNTFIALSLVFVLATPSYCDIKIGENTTVAFATVEEGKGILATSDDYSQRLSEFDKAAKMQTDKDVSEKDYLQSAAANVLAWTSGEKTIVESAIISIKPQLDALSLPWPQTIYLIKTTGREEGGASYTRSNAVVIPRRMLDNGDQTRIARLIAHESFHVLSRKNPVLREKLYSSIGFQRCKEMVLPSKLAARIITNPDAPTIDQCIHLKLDGAEIWATPLIFSETEKYDVNRGGTFFNYLKFQLLVVKKDDSTTPPTMTCDAADFRLVDEGRVSGFFEQIGRNTTYTIHPEEILADNFALIVLGQEQVQSPEIIQKMKKILADSHNTQPRDSNDATNRQ